MGIGVYVDCFVFGAAELARRWRRHFCMYRAFANEYEVVIMYLNGCSPVAFICLDGRSTALILSLSYLGTDRQQLYCRQSASDNVFKTNAPVLRD